LPLALRRERGEKGGVIHLGSNRKGFSREKKGEGETMMPILMPEKKKGGKKKSKPSTAIAKKKKKKFMPTERERGKRSSQPMKKKKGKGRARGPRSLGRATEIEGKNRSTWAPRKRKKKGKERGGGSWRGNKGKKASAVGVEKGKGTPNRFLGNSEEKKEGRNGAGPLVQRGRKKRRKKGNFAILRRIKK